MKLPELKRDYYEFSKAASNKVRQMAFAGIAVIWIFRTTSTEGVHFDKTLFWSLAILVITLALDFLQNLYQVIIWQIYYNRRERELRDKSGNIDTEKKFYLPSYLNIITIVLFYTKIAALIIAYSTLIKYLYQELI